MSKDIVFSPQRWLDYIYWQTEDKKTYPEYQIFIRLLPSYVLASDVCICPIVNNTQHSIVLANKLFQYAMFERPLIVSNCPPQVDFINENKCGLVFRSGDSNDLAQQIDYLLNNPDKCREYGENGRRAVEERYNTAVFKESLFKAYSEIITHISS